MIKAANDHARRDRARLSVQPEQPDRPDRHQAGSQAAARRHPEGHAGAHRRGVPPLRRRPELRDLGAVRHRRAPGDHRAHVLEDRGARRHAPRLRDRDARRSSQKMRPYSMGSINALVKHGGAASLKDTAAQADVKSKTIDAPQEDHRGARGATATRRFRRRPTSSWCTIGREDAADDRGVPRRRSLVGRPFPPMTDAHARLGRHGGRDGALHDRVQGDLPAEGQGNDGRRVSAIRIANCGIRNSSAIRNPHKGGDREIAALFLASYDNSVSPPPPCSPPRSGARWLRSRSRR